MIATTKSIYVDLKKLRSLLKKAQFLMAGNLRSAYAIPAINECSKCINTFVDLFYEIDDFAKKKKSAKLRNHFTILKIECEDIIEERLLKGKDEISGLTDKQAITEMTDYLGKINIAIDNYLVFLNKSGLKTTCVGE